MAWILLNHTKDGSQARNTLRSNQRHKGLNNTDNSTRKPVQKVEHKKHPRKANTFEELKALDELGHHTP